MPCYRTHDFSTIITAIGVFLYSLRFERVNELLIVVIGILFSGLLCNGDLDTDSRIYKRWGWFRFYWLPYKKWIPHRHILSHGPILGTTIRLLYLSPLLILLYLILIECNIKKEIEWDLIIGFVIGCEIAQLLHTGLDYLIKNKKN